MWSVHSHVFERQLFCGVRPFSKSQIAAICLLALSFLEYFVETIVSE